MGSLKRKCLFGSSQVLENPKYPNRVYRLLEALYELK
jgi:hypothetical protein